MIPKLLTFGLQMVTVFWMFIAGAVGLYRYERLPVGWPNYKVTAIPFWRPVIHLPRAGAVTAQAEALAALRSAEAAAVRRAAQVGARQAAIATAIDAHQQAIQTQIRWRIRTLLQELPHAVTPAYDRRYPLSVGWVRWHDAAALGTDLSAVPRPAGAADDAPSVVKPSDALAAIGANYADCRADAAQLADFQAYWRQVSAAQVAPPAATTGGKK